MGWEGGIPIGTAHATSEDNLQAQLEALEAGLPPLVVSANHGSMNSGDLINDLHVRHIDRRKRFGILSNPPLVRRVKMRFKCTWTLRLT